MQIRFVIVEDVMNPLIGPDALHQNGVSSSPEYTVFDPQSTKQIIAEID